MLTSPTTRRAGWLLAVASCSLALAACGDDSGSSDSGSGDTSSSTATEQDSAQVRLQECLRENGVDLPEGAPGEGGAPPADIDQEALDEAFAACEEFQDEAFGESGLDTQEFEDQAARFTQCMRDEGIDVPDIDLDGGPPADGGGLDQDDPDVQAALEVCQDELPAGGPGGGAAP